MTDADKIRTMFVLALLLLLVMFIVGLLAKDEYIVQAAATFTAFNGAYAAHAAREAEAFSPESRRRIEYWSILGAAFLLVLGYLALRGVLC